MTWMSHNILIMLHRLGWCFVVWFRVILIITRVPKKEKENLTTRCQQMKIFRLDDTGFLNIVTFILDEYVQNILQPVQK